MYKIDPKDYEPIITSIEVEKMLDGLFKLPTCKVDRNDFLIDSFSAYYPMDKVMELLETSPIKAQVPAELLDRVSRQAIKSETYKATGYSFLTGASPAGLLTAVPAATADMVQFLVHSLRLSQKLAYLYGWPELTEMEGGKKILTVFMGCMLGVDNAEATIEQLSEELVKQYNRNNDSEEFIVSTPLVITFVKNITEAMAVVLSKQAGKNIAGKALPLIGGFISGGLTYYLFKNAGEALQAALKKHPIVEPFAITPEEEEPNPEATEEETAEPTEVSGKEVEAEEKSEASVEEVKAEVVEKSQEEAKGEPEPEAKAEPTDK